MSFPASKILCSTPQFIASKVENMATGPAKMRGHSVSRDAIVIVRVSRMSKEVEGVRLNVAS